jgi:nickel transport protein
MKMTSTHRRVRKLWIGMGLVAGLATLAPTADAHGIWFAQRARQLALVYGVGADDLDAVKRLPLINSVKGFDAQGLPVKVSLRTAGAIPVVDSDEPIAIVAAAMDYGLWTKTPDGEWHNKGRDEVPNATLAEHNWKYAVHLTQMPTKPVPQIEGHTLQLVPATTAIPQKAGEPFTVRAMYKGKPIAGAIIMSDYVNDPDEAGVKTAADGTATIRLRNQGINVIMAIYVGLADEPKKADHSEYRSSLSFVLPHAPE